jgi:hypothetical protein
MNAKQLDIVTKTAVQTALEYLEKEKQKQQKLKRDRRLRNIRLLLKNYRVFVKHAEKIKDELVTFDSKAVMDELYEDDFALESIKRSKQRTLAMVQFMQRMLNVYRIMCEESNNSEEKRRYQVIYAMYLSDKKSTAEEIAKSHFIDRSTVFRDVNKACETLSVLIFGVDAIKFE